MEIGKYKNLDELEILKLFELSFGKSLSMEYWNWRFNNNPFTDEKFIHLMWDNNVLVGHYAVSPVDIIINNEIVKSALSMTTMTHPDYGGQGIFSQLAASVYEHQRQASHKLVWGFPNTNSHYGFKKNLEWKDIAILPMMSLYAHNIPTKTHSIQYEDVDNFTAQIAEIFNASSKPIRINKTMEYLNWRYIHNPSATYHTLINSSESIGVIYKIIDSFTEKHKKEVDILDMQFQGNKDILISLLRTILDRQDDDICKINVWCSLHDDEHLLYEKIGFFHTSPLTYFSARSFESNTDQVLNFKNWDISFSYSDIF